MLILRKTDFYMEAGVLILLFISIPVLYAYSFLTGLLVLGIFQLLSAGLNTKAFVHKALKREIKRYWIFTGSILLITALFFIGGKKDLTRWILLIACTVTTIYYLIIYQKLISNIKWRNELAGFTKS